MRGVIDKNSMTLYLYPEDLKRYPEFQINNPVLWFNSHLITDGWTLRINQNGKFHGTGSDGEITEIPALKTGSYVGSARISLIYDDGGTGGGSIPSRMEFKIRVPARKTAFRSMEELIGMIKSSTITSVHDLKMVPKDIGAYSEEELLAEVRHRMEARLGPIGTKKRVVPAEVSADIIRIEDRRRIVRSAGELRTEAKRLLSA